VAILPASAAARASSTAGVRRSTIRLLGSALVLALVAVGLLPTPAHADRSTRAEARLLALMEAERTGAGAPGWSRVDDLTAVAVRWSARMAQDHGADGGQDHNPALSAEVCCYRRIAENVGWVSGADRDLDGAADRLHAAFMASSSHRSNVLASAHTHVGVGVELHPSGNLYVTVVFREPDGSAAPAAPAPPSSSGSSSDRPASSRSTPTPTADPTPKASEDAEPRPDPSPSAAPAAVTEADGTTASSEGPAPDEAADDPAMSRDREELARFARWALTERDRRLQEERIEEVRTLVASLGELAAPYVDALRWALRWPRHQGTDVTTQAAAVAGR
jgi:uncharacterized protein YkwD